jgi:hypothetical protein
VGNPVIESLLLRIGDSDLLKKLDLLTASELNSFMLEVMRRRSQSMDASDLMRAYEQNRFVAPSAIDPVAFLQNELQLLNLAKSNGFETLELSPLAPFGNCSVIGQADQNKIVSAMRGTEVVADATNLMALESSLRRKRSAFNSSIVTLSAVHRHVRAQALPPVKGFTAHFKIFCAVTAGRDEGGYAFEKAAMLSHLALYKNYLADTLKIKKVRVIVKGLIDKSGTTPVSTKIFEHLSANLEGVDLAFLSVPESEHKYYQHTRFSIDVEHDSRMINIGDGGFVDWGQKLTSNAKERMLTSGIGIELLIKLRLGLI